MNLRIKVDTLTPTRNPVFLVVPKDYSSIYNVTGNGGAITGRRYLGEPKFYALIVNLTDPANGYNRDKRTWLVPRSLFFDTYLPPT